MDDLLEQLAQERAKSAKLVAALKEIIRPSKISKCSAPTQGRPWVIMAKKAILEYEHG